MFNVKPARYVRALSSFLQNNMRIVDTAIDARVSRVCSAANQTSSLCVESTAVYTTMLDVPCKGLLNIARKSRRSVKPEAFEAGEPAGTQIVL